MLRLMTYIYQLQDVTSGMEDESFQYRVYAGSRADEIANWGWDAAQQEMFLRMQFRMQQQSYAAQYPGSRYQIIVWNGERAGHALIVRLAESILIADLALLPPLRNRGIGSRIIQGLQEEAAKDDKHIRLRVLKTNIAFRLYERLGFRVTGEYGLHLEMEWRNR